MCVGNASDAIGLRLVPRRSRAWCRQIPIPPAVANFVCVTGQPWLGDACSLVDAFRDGEISPTEALEGSLAAIEKSSLNAVCFIDEETGAGGGGIGRRDPAVRRRAHGCEGARSGQGLAADRGVARASRTASPSTTAP